MQKFTKKCDIETTINLFCFFAATYQSTNVLSAVIMFYDRLLNTPAVTCGSAVTQHWPLSGSVPPTFRSLCFDWWIWQLFVFLLVVWTTLSFCHWTARSPQSALQCSVDSSGGLKSRRRQQSKERTEEEAVGGKNRDPSIKKRGGSEERKRRGRERGGSS